VALVPHSLKGLAVRSLTTKVLRFSLAMAMLLAFAWPVRISAAVDTDHRPHSVMKDGDQPVHCPCVRATEFVRLCTTLKAGSACNLLESIQAAPGQRPIESIRRAGGFGANPTLQSQSVRLQV